MAGKIKLTRQYLIHSSGTLAVVFHSPDNREDGLRQVVPDEMLELRGADQECRRCGEPGQHRVGQEGSDRPDAEDAHDHVPDAHAQRESQGHLDLDGNTRRSMSCCLVLNLAAIEVPAHRRMASRWQRDNREAARTLLPSYMPVSSLSSCE